MPFKPIGNRIFAVALGHAVSPDLATSQLIVLPEKYEPDPVVFRVSAIGPGKRKQDGSLEPIGCEVGWRVVCKAALWNSPTFEFDGVPTRIIDWDKVELVLPP